MQSLNHLLENNRAWAESMRDVDPHFFEKLTAQQKPEILWIGCADSRVPANQITGLLPGEVFVHRNIANLVVHTDLNCLSVLQYAVDVLKVRHVIVCGHYGCGGVAAALQHAEYGLLDNWLRHLKDSYQLNRAELDPLEPQARYDRFCEINVIEQVNHVCQTTIVQDAWRRGQEIALHGWIYAVSDGLLRDLNITVTSPDSLPELFRMKPLNG